MPDARPTPETAAQFLISGMLKNCRESSLKKREELDQLLSAGIPKYASEDTSLVVFGSLARQEWTSGSDLDWTYLIDGEANSDHLRIAQEIRRLLESEKGKFKPPGQTETFGNLAFSHDLIHQIGGQNDTNKNTTRRVLLLLESVPIGRRTEAHERVLRGVVNRYLEEDNHPLTADGKRYRVPRFLLNDLVRFWRTMAVDFASKQRDRGGSGWGLRNAKLRMSRKLIFASGLLVCFSANLDPEPQSRISTDNSDIKLPLVKHIRDSLRLTPLDILAKSIEKYEIPQLIGEELFGSYTEFLEIIDDEASRHALEVLRASDSRTDRTFQRVRKVSEAFGHALDYIFFENKLVAPLTRKYGVF
ncbi:MAG TPA: nucleotidyltransferase domain-containing protein [Terriglobales bacterium]|nr:nucleotidyltransferase domain-containing protein [Terriglobales bacterium]